MMCFCFYSQIFQENDMEDDTSVRTASTREESDVFLGGPVSREDYVHNEPQPGTSELCERLQRFVLNVTIQSTFFSKTIYFFLTGLIL